KGQPLKHDFLSFRRFQPLGFFQGSKELIVVECICHETWQAVDQISSVPNVRSHSLDLRAEEISVLKKRSHAGKEMLVISLAFDLSRQPCPLCSGVNQPFELLM